MPISMANPSPWQLGFGGTHFNMVELFLVILGPFWRWNCFHCLKRREKKMR